MLLPLCGQWTQHRRIQVEFESNSSAGTWPIRPVDWSCWTTISRFNFSFPSSTSPPARSLAPQHTAQGCEIYTIVLAVPFLQAQSQQQSTTFSVAPTPSTNLVGGSVTNPATAFALSGWSRVLFASGATRVIPHRFPIAALALVITSFIFFRRIFTLAGSAAHTNMTSTACLSRAAGC